MNNEIDLNLISQNIDVELQKNDINIDLNNPIVDVNIDTNDISVELNKPMLELDLQMGAAGAPGRQGNPGEDAKINGVNTLNILAGNNIQLTQTNNDLVISATGEVSIDYNNLSNLPSINGVTIEGDKDSFDYNLVSDDNYVHTDNNYTNIDKERVEGYVHIQGSPSSMWTIEHNLNKYPSCTIVNSAGDEVYGDILYNNSNLLTINFNGSFSGKAYLN